MEHTGIDDGSELASESAEVERIGYLEVNAQFAVLSLLPRRLDGGRREVDPHHLDPPLRDHQRVLARPAAAVEHRRGQLPHIGQADECWLRSADVPRWAAGPIGLVPASGGAPGRRPRLHA